MSSYWPPIRASSGFGIHVGQYTDAATLSASTCQPLAHMAGQLARGAAAAPCASTPSASATRPAAAVTLMAGQGSALHGRAPVVDERRHHVPGGRDRDAARR